MAGIEETYHDLFEGLGNLGPKLYLEVDPEVPPVQIPPRKIPESLKQPLKEHLEQLVQQRVIEPVDFQQTGSVQSSLPSNQTEKSDCVSIHDP